MLSFIGSREERKSCEKLDHDASETPHVNLLGVWEESKNDIRCSVEPTLNISIYNFVLQASTSKVCHHDSRFVFPFEQDVLRLQITMDYAKVFHVPQSRQQLDCKSSDEAIFKALVVVHLDELVQIDAVQIKDAAEMVSEYKVVSQLNHSFDVVRIAFLEKEEELCFDCCLVVVLLLVLYKLDGNQLLMLVVHALDDLSESSLSNHLNELVSVSNMVLLLYPVVPFVIVITIINQPLQLGRLYLHLVLAEVKQLLILVNLCFLEVSQVLLSDVLLLSSVGLHGELQHAMSSFDYCVFISLRCFWNDGVESTLAQFVIMYSLCPRWLHRTSWLMRSSFISILFLQLLHI